MIKIHKKKLGNQLMKAHFDSLWKLKITKPCVRLYSQNKNHFVEFPPIRNLPEPCTLSQLPSNHAKCQSKCGITRDFSFWLYYHFVGKPSFRNNSYGCTKRLILTLQLSVQINTHSKVYFCVLQMFVAMENCVTITVWCKRTAA